MEVLHTTVSSSTRSTSFNTCSQFATPVARIDAVTPSLMKKIHAQYNNPSSSIQSDVSLGRIVSVCHNQPYPTRSYFWAHVPQEFLNKVDVREHHAPAAVPVEAEFIHGLPALYIASVSRHRVSRLSPDGATEYWGGSPVGFCVALVVNHLSDKFDVLFVEVGDYLHPRVG